MKFSAPASPALSGANTMINYLTIKYRDGRRTLSILNTEPANTAEQIEHAATVRNIRDDIAQFDKIEVIAVKGHHTETVGASVEALIAGPTAARCMWTLYDEKGELIGSSNGDWKSWHVKSRLVDNAVLSRFVLAEMEHTKRPPGRPTTLNGKPRNVTLDDERVEFSKQLGGGNLSEGIRQALDLAKAKQDQQA